jgi:transposase
VAASSLREQVREALAVIEQLGVENEALRAETEKLRAENAALRDRISHLESEMNRDSSTSSKPPSTDPIGPRQSRAERRAAARAADRRQGKQPGTPGTNLERRQPDAVIKHRPAHCKSCGADLADAALISQVRRQVIDLPPVRPTVTDHLAYRCRSRCGVET